MNIYSFRAECDADVQRLRTILAKIGFGVITAKPGNTSVEMHVEFLTPMDQETIEEAMRSIEDGHVMIQTLRPVPLKQNSLERDYTRA